MTEEPLGCSEALLCISNQCAIFSQFLCDGGQTLQLPAGRAEKMVILQNPALLLFLSQNAQLLLYTLFHLHLGLFMKASYRTELVGETVIFITTEVLVLSLFQPP